MAPSSAPGGDTRLALAAGISCYLIWGLVPLVFQLVARLGASPWEILAHRAVWGVPAALALVLWARQGRASLAVFGDPRTLAWLALSAALILVNWSTFIWAVNAGRVLETSLGYYILPLINMAAGALIFRERLDRTAAVSIAVSALGVALQALALGRLPLISLVLAASFAGYGIVRKRVSADAQTGLFVECALLAIPAVLFVLWLEARGEGHFGRSLPISLWLIACGPLTAVTLVLFSWAARRVPLSVMGFLQFIAPTLSLVIGVLQGEAFGPLRALSFAMIWAGVVVFVLGAWRSSRRAAELVALSES